jgi:hypothetical protein
VEIHVKGIEVDEGRKTVETEERRALSKEPSLPNFFQGSPECLERLSEKTRLSPNPPIQKETERVTNEDVKAEE